MPASQHLPDGLTATPPAADAQRVHHDLIVEALLRAGLPSCGTRTLEYELNNVLMALVGNVDLIETALPPGAAAAPYLAELRAAAERTLVLARQLADAARLRAMMGDGDVARVRFLPE